MGDRANNSEWTQKWTFFLTEFDIFQLLKTFITPNKIKNDKKLYKIGFCNYSNQKDKICFVFAKYIFFI